MPPTGLTLDHALWSAAADSLESQVAILDESGVIVAVNAAWRRFGAAAGVDTDFVGHSYLAACQPSAVDQPGRRDAADEGEVVAAGLRALLDGGSDPFAVTYPCHSPTMQRWFRLHAFRFAGAEAAVVVTHQDVSQEWRAEQEAATQGALLDVIDVAVVATDAGGCITHWNHGAQRLYGWTRDEALGAAEDDRVGSQGKGRILPGGADRRFAEDAPSEARGVFLRRDGSAFAGYERRSPRLDDKGERIGTIAVSLDETARVQAENYLDAVTDSMGEGLFALDAAGRVAFANRAAESMLGWSLAQIAGHSLHDLTHYRHEDGSDFPVEDCPIMAAWEFGATVRVAVDSFIAQDGRLIPVSYTATPLRDPDGGEGCVVVFSDATHARTEQARLEEQVEKLSSARRVEEALREDRFVLYAQPIVDLRTGATTQHELLLRVQERNGEVSGPLGYLAAAEEHGLVGTIDRWVIAQAVLLAAQGHDVEVNVSASSISEPGLLKEIEAMLTASGADPGRLVFEITETAVMVDSIAGEALVHGLHELGCRVALDDFGTGYGGFTYLKQLPVDLLKIDIEFVRDLSVNSSSRHVVAAVVALAAGFGLQTVAEGVEDAATLHVLTELGVDYAQGFHLGRPAPVAEVLPTR